MCKEGFTDDTHTRCLGDSIDSDSGASGYLSSSAEKAADAAPDGTTVDKFLMFFLVVGGLAIIGAVIVIGGTSQLHLRTNRQCTLTTKGVIR